MLVVWKSRSDLAKRFGKAIEHCKAGFNIPSLATVFQKIGLKAMNANASVCCELANCGLCEISRAKRVQTSCVKHELTGDSKDKRIGTYRQEKGWRSQCLRQGH